MAFIEQFKLPGLGHASYLVGSEQSGQAVVIDPNRNVAQYIDAAERHGVRIAWVLDTHGHNDYLSGTHELAERTGAERLAPIGASTGYVGTFGYPGFEVDLGDARLELVHTPGHTPEHTALIGTGFGDAPVLFSGGSLLVGDVGRPDLLGDDAQRERAAHALVHTMLDVFGELPDETVVYPTHIGGSLCAGAIGEGDSTTLGEERRTNPTLRAMTADRAGLAGWLDPSLLPPVPSFWPTARATNLAGVAAPRREPLEELTAATLGATTTLLDVRPLPDIVAAPIADAIAAPHQGAFVVWAGIAVDGNFDVTLVANSAEDAHLANESLLVTHQLGARGWIAPSELASRTEPSFGQRATDAMPTIEREQRTLIDVRNPSEVAARPLPGAVAIPAAIVLNAPHTLPQEPLTIACASGFRAVIAASVARRLGYDAIAIVNSPFSALTTAAG